MRQSADGDERILVVLQMADLVFAGDIRRCNDAHDAGQRLGRGGINGQHTGTGILAAHRAAVAHAVHIHIVGVLAVALYLLGHVQTVDTAAHLPVVGGCLGQLALPEDPGRQQDAVDDLHIAGAAAAGDAEAALHRARLAEGEGIDLLFPVAETLHREDGLALQLVRLGNAGLGGLAVDEHMAGATSRYISGNPLKDYNFVK